MPQSNGAIGDPNDGLPQFFDNFERFGKSEVSAGGLDGLKNEVAVEYDRAHNKLLFDLEMSSKSNDFSTGLPLFYAVPNKQEMDLILPGYRMADAKKRFTTATFLTSVEVLRNLSIARGECDRLIVYEMFPIMSKVVNLSEFRQIQYRSISDMRIYLQQEWIAKLGDAVLSGFSEVGKGWYNTEESNIEVYKIGKLSNCMKVLTFMMQDSLRTFMISSLEAFANQICQYPTSQIAISGLKNIEINGDANFLFNLHKKPLFAVKIRSDGEKFQYDTDLEDLEKAVVAIMAEAVAVTENLPQLETLVLRNIFFATKPVLQRIFPDDPEVLNLQSRVAQAIKGSILKLKEYLCYFDEYFKIMKIDVGQFAAEYEASNKSLDEMNNDILYYSEEWKTIEENIPRHLTIGLFSISCEDAISSLNKNLGRVILDLIAKKALALVNTILENFLKIQTQLEEKPRDEDDIILLRQFLETVPVLVESNAALLIEVQNHCAVLDSYNYERSKDDHQATWTALSWPKRIEEKLTELKILFEEEDRSVVVEVPVDVEESI